MSLKYSSSASGIKIERCTGTDSSLEIPSRIGRLSVTQIGTNAFANCVSLVSITIPDSVKEIGDGAFRGCTSLTSIRISDSVTKIKAATFAKCKSLMSITLPKFVTEIEDTAFAECTSLMSITIPNSVIYIGNCAFAKCMSLITIRIPDSVRAIGEGVFTGCTALKTIDSPLIPFFKDAEFIYRKMDDRSVCVDGYIGKNSEIIVPAHVKAFPVVKIGRFAFVGSKRLETITISDSVKMIGDGAFEACSSLKAICIPKSVSQIGASAFYACTSLKSIVVPNSVTTINSGTFSECTSLETITIPNSVETIGDCAFEECASLKEITLSDSVKVIGYGAFTGCTALEFIIIPDSVTELVNNPFVRCNKLTDIYLPETLSHGLEVEEFFSELCNDNNCNVHFYTTPYPIFLRIIKLKKERNLSQDVSDWLTQIERLMEANVNIDERVKNSVMTILNDIEKVHRLQGKIRTNSVFNLISLLNEVVENKTVNAAKYEQRYTDDIAELTDRVKENLGALFVGQKV